MSDAFAAAKRCTNCGRIAVTQDGRLLCLRCLKQQINRDTPIVGALAGRLRTQDQKQAPEYDSNPWQEVAIRRLEDTDIDPLS